MRGKAGVAAKGVAIATTAEAGPCLEKSARALRSVKRSVNKSGKRNASRNAGRRGTRNTDRSAEEILRGRELVRYRPHNFSHK